MDRRQVLKAGVATGAVLALPGCTTAHSRSSPARSSAGRSLLAGATPSRRAWAALEAGLDGDLVRPGEAGFAHAKRLYDPRFDPVVPAAVVRAASVADVTETIAFARRHGLGLRPKSGGHSYVGASTGAGCVQLDLGRLAEVTWAGPDHVRVQPGARLFAVHEVLAAAGRTLPTGTCPTVGVAGLSLGGGVGVESRLNGLTCDALEEVVLVTAAGAVRTADRTRHPDLFWASRGGGGGSFGVVTSQTFRTFPAHPMGFFFLHFAATHAADVISGWQRRLALMPRSSWANVHVDAVPGGGLDVRVVGLSLSGDGHSEAAALVAAIGREPTRATLFSRSHHDGTRLLAGCSGLADTDCAPEPGGALGREAFVAGGDVVGTALTRADVSAAVAHVRARAAAGGAGTLILDPLGGRVGDVGPQQSAFRWRGALGIAQWYVPTSAAPSRSAVRAAYSFVRGGHQALGRGSLGGYVNYPEPGRPLRSYYGGNFARLRAVKARYDPDDFFRSGYTIPPG